MLYDSHELTRFVTCLVFTLTLLEGVRKQCLRNFYIQGFFLERSVLEVTEKYEGYHGKLSFGDTCMNTLETTTDQKNQAAKESLLEIPETVATTTFNLLKNYL